MDLSDSTALVTGAASGLGAATASALAARRVAVLGLDLPAQLEKATAPDGVTFLAADVTDEAQVAAALATIASPLRLVVNCAGIAPAIRLLSSRGVHDVASFERTIDVNTVGTFNVMRLAAELMATNEPVDDDGQRGLIVNTASVAAFDGQIGQVAYAASKGAIVGMTLPAARDLAAVGIRVCTIAPGLFDTPLLATLPDAARAALSKDVVYPGRLGRPEEYAKLVRAIVDIGYLNGEVIRLDGGIRMQPK